MRNRFYLWLLRKFGNLSGIVGALESTGGRYLNVETYATIEGISQRSAQRALAEGVESGILRKVYLYQSPDVDVPIILEEEDLDKELSLAEFGINAEPDETLYLSKYSTTEIYVDAAKG